MSIIEGYLKDFIDGLQPMCGGELGKIQKKAYEENMPVIPNDVVKLLSFILSVKRPEKILEIGTAIGFSSIMMCGYLAEGGSVTTIDRYPFMIEKAKENFKKLGVEDRITLIEGDANDVLKELDEKFDLIFMDAAKGQYINILPDCYRLLKVGGIIIADDIFQNGNVAKDRFDVKRRQRTIHQRLRDFLKEITSNPCFVTSLVTIGDGVALCHKIAETTERV